VWQIRRLYKKAWVTRSALRCSIRESGESPPYGEQPTRGSMSFPTSKVMGRAIRLPKSSLVSREKDRTPAQAPDRSAVTSSSALLRQVVYRGRFGRGVGDVVRLQLPALTYSLGNFIRTLAVTEAAEPCWPISPLASPSGVLDRNARGEDGGAA
jgi:hypothetical protein